MQATWVSSGSDVTRKSKNILRVSTLLSLGPGWIPGLT